MPTSRADKTHYDILLFDYSSGFHQHTHIRPSLPMMSEIMPNKLGTSEYGHGSTLLVPKHQKEIFCSCRLIKLEILSNTSLVLRFYRSASHLKENANCPCSSSHPIIKTGLCPLERLTTCWRRLPARFGPKYAHTKTSGLRCTIIYLVVPL